VTASERDSASPAEQVARLYEQAETEAAKAAERLVGSGGFASLLGQLAENAAAMTKLTNDAMDLVLRNLRVASRRDIVRLSRQLGRTEDKLERVLQELEEVRDQLANDEARRPPARRDTRVSRGSRGNGTEATEQKAPS
jgi:hypothetical protein